MDGLTNLFKEKSGRISKLVKKFDSIFLADRVALKLSGKEKDRGRKKYVRK